MTGKKVNKIAAYTVASAIVVLCASIYIIFLLPNSFGESPRYITVSKGQSFSSVADSLVHKGIISSRMTFSIAGRILGVTQKMRVGKYSFASGASNHEILNSFENGSSTIYSRITLREGVRTSMFARILKKHVGIDSVRFMEVIRDTSLIGMDRHGAKSLEGYLMPDTYSFPWQEDEREIVQQMVAEFQKFFADSLKKRMKKLGFSLNDVMTMASIVEGEAVYDDERPIIAGVYYNRLRIRMPLQADPTVLYAVSEIPRRLKKTDMTFDSPYNTYLHYGLPPGPINNPSRNSIIAALYPAKHQFLYFVADNNGRHRFSRDYNQHLRNIRLYRKARAMAQNGG